MRVHDLLILLIFMKITVDVTIIIMKLFVDHHPHYDDGPHHCDHHEGYVSPTRRPDLTLATATDTSLVTVMMILVMVMMMMMVMMVMFVMMMMVKRCNSK